MSKIIKNETVAAEKMPSTSAELSRQDWPRAFETGLNRRAFLRASSALTLLAGLSLTKPQILAAKTTQGQALPKVDIDDNAKAVIVQVQAHLFPDDGDGPSAADLHAFEYLRWALTDPDNQADGDQEFVLQGVTWLQDLSISTHGEGFLKLDFATQGELLEKIARSRAGENWLSLLLYYLLEALTLDPVYGGNPDGIGWKWLEHQPGYPAPVLGKTYRDFF